MLAVYDKESSVSCEYTGPFILQPHQAPRWPQRTEHWPACGQFLPKIQLSLCKRFKTPFKTGYVFEEKEDFWISALQMSGKNRNNFESLLGLWTNPVYKTSWASLPAKQAVTVGLSSVFNMKLLHDWSNFDLPKLMPVENTFLMPSTCLSPTLIHARIHANELLITAQPIRNLRTPASAEMNKRGFL